jgi:hypothetical protein
MLDPDVVRPSITKRDKVFHVAYGSNMSTSKLLSRTPNGCKPIIPLSASPCTVLGFSLRYRLGAFPPSEPCMADAAAEPGKTLHGVLYEFSREVYDTLCISEHAATRSPSYVEVVVDAYPYPVSIGGDSSTTPPPPVQATILVIARPVQEVPSSVSAHVRPSIRYLNLIRNGAREAGLDDDYQAKLEAQLPARPAAGALIETSLFGIFTIMQANWRVSVFVKSKVSPPLVHIYARREHAAAEGRWLAETAWDSLLICAILPLSVLGAACKIVVKLRGASSRIIFRES